jgi:hypothetical protein
MKRHLSDLLVSSVASVVSSVSCQQCCSALTGIGFFLGYFINEWIFQARQQNWRPHYRLHGVWAAIFFMAAGLIIYGLTLNFQRSWVGLLFGWIFVVIGMVASTV